MNFEFVLLTLLLERPKHGYELLKDLNAWEGLAEVWKLKQSMLYADLNKLEKLGYIASEEPDLSFTPPRVVMKITVEGKKALEAWVKSPVQKPREIRPEFLTKLLVASRLGSDYSRNLIEAQRVLVQHWLSVDKQRAALYSTLSPEALMVFDFRSHWLANVSAWLDDCLRTLNSEISD